MINYLLVCMLMPLAMSQYMSFEEFIAKFHKTYKEGTPEYSEKKTIYQENVEALKQKNCSVCGVTKFFDQRAKQFEKKTLNLQLSENKTSDKFPENAQQVYKVGSPRSVDWRKNGVITSIKTQGECGSCWAFTSAALGQSSLILKGLADKNIDLSEQFLVECTEDSDCGGGFLQQGIDQMIASGIPVQSRYPYDPYKKHPGICYTIFNTKISKKPRLSFYDLTDEEIKDLLTLGPLAVALSSTDWQYYSKGIWKCKYTDPVNHAVLLVGYTQNAWIVKNQWGEDWGENGYIYISMNPRQNCKINTAVHMLSQSYTNYFLMFVCALLICLLS